MTCDSCEKQFLPYLYELLDPPERDELEAHLRECPHCHVELERARVRRADIATAVKSSFPDIVFKTPRHPIKAARAAPPPRVPRRPLLLSRWGMAAAILMAVMSMAGVGAACMYYYQSATLADRREKMEQQQAQLVQIQRRVDAKQARVNKDIDAIQAEIGRLLGDWDNQVQRRQDPKHNSVFFEIKGPRTVQAGGVNRYDVQVKPTGAQQPAKVARLRAEVVNQKTKAVVFEKTLTDNHLILPPNLPVRPNDDLALVLHADVDGGQAEVREQLTLAFPDYVTYLSTDRPMYRPGEMVRFRSLTLERFSLQPASEDLAVRFRITAPNDVEVFKREVSTRLVADKDKHRVEGPDGQPLHGIGTGEFTLPRQLPGGIYTLSVSEVNDRFPAEKRTFIVHRWQAPRFNKEMEFDRASYGPNEPVRIRGKVTRLGQQPGAMGGAMGPGAAGGGMGAGMPGGGAFAPGGFGPENIQIHASVIVDGVQIFGNNRNADPDGSFVVDFNLPNNLTQGNGVVTLQFNDNATVETLVRTIPIVLRDVFVDFYPEGGNLVLDVPNRVYFQARTSAYTPVAIHGALRERDVTYDKPGREILGKQVRDVTPIATFADTSAPAWVRGSASSPSRPRPTACTTCRSIRRSATRARIAWQRRAAKARRPNDSVVHVPAADGVALHLPQGVVAKNIPLTLYSGQRDRELLVGAYCRGKLLDSTVVRARAGAEAKVSLNPAVDVGGVYRITVFDKQQADGATTYKPVAERLTFRKQTARLHVAIRPQQSEYTPGDRVALNLAATNERKEFVPSVVMCAVVDSSVLKLAGDKTERGMPAHFLLTNEIRRPEDLENADALLNETNPRAAEALDLLLGTQGWRRFAEQDPQRFLQKRNARPGAFLASAHAVARVSAGGQQTLDNLDRKYVGDFIALETKLAQKEREHDSVPELQQLAMAQNTLNVAGQAVGAETERLNDLASFFFQAGVSTAVGLLVFFAFFLVATSLYRLAEGKSGYILLGAGLCLLGFLFVVSVLGTFAMIGSPMDNNLFARRRGGFFGGGVMMAPAMQMPMQERAGGMALVQLPDDPRYQLERPEQMEAGAEAPMGPGGIGVPQPFDQGFINPQGFDPERTLRQQGRYQELLQRKLNRKVHVPPPVEASVVREYAHQHKADPNQVRRDFAETLYWQPALVLKDGQGTVGFALSDAVTNFRVLAVSHSLDGRLGTDTIEFSSRLPYQIEPKVPIEVASSDRVDIPVAVTNNSNAQSTFDVKMLRANGVQLVEAVKIPGQDPNKPAVVDPGQSRRQLFRFRPTIASGNALVRFQGKFAKGTDTVERTFAVAPDGFPIHESVSGTLEGTGTFTTQIHMPSDWIAGSLALQVQAYPTVLADLQQGVDALLREPLGCFEQASSSNYPNVLILNYLQDSKQANPAVEARARKLMDHGYQRLLSFECIPPDHPQQRRGYEWFGQTAPPHEALTAYGLLQFHDMARVYPVDPAMIERTRKYLLDQRDGKGGFKRNARAVDQFGRAPQDITNAYIVWALTETGTRNELSTELDALYTQGKKSRDAYFVALTSLGQLNAGRTEPALELLRRMRTFQRVSGEVPSARTSITNSAGRDLIIETTALSALGWLRAGRPAEFNDSAHKAGQWLVKQRSGTGGFGATQSTVLALKALLAFAAQNQKAIQPADLRVEITRGGNGQVISREARLSPGMREAVTLQLKENAADDKQESLLVRGANQLDVRLTDGNNRLPFVLTWSYRTRKPVNSGIAPVQLDAHLDKPEVTEGTTVKLHVDVANKSGEDQGMAVAVIGLPAGLALPDDFRQLKELSRLSADGKPGKIAAWEMHGSRELVLYWRELKADAKIALPPLDLVARLPGIYSGPASRAYLYYNAEHKHWIDPLHVRVKDLPR